MQPLLVASAAFPEYQVSAIRFDKGAREAAMAWLLQHDRSGARSTCLAANMLLVFYWGRLTRNEINHFCRSTLGGWYGEIKIGWARASHPPPPPFD